MWSRRAFLGATCAATLPFFIGARVRAEGTGRPRTFCSILLKGGIDPVTSFDPKRRSEVESFVDLPVDQRPRAAREVPFGPHAEELAASALPFAIVRGVRLNTGNHATGYAQHTRMRTHISEAMPTLFDIIGAHRSGPPLPTLSLGYAESLFSSSWFGAELLPRIEALAPSDLQTLSAVQRAEASALRHGSAEEAQTAGALSASADLFERMPTLKPFALDASWPDGSERFQRALWAIENDVAATVYISALADFDTHSRNAFRQQRAAHKVIPGLARFLVELSARRNRFGTLAETTTVVVGSEIGRLPRLNALEGKDHFPEAPFLFFGAGINTRGGSGAVYGVTGRQMEGQPVDLTTGLGSAAGSQLHLDDLGATLLHLAGLSPDTHGSSGRVLRFLVA